MQFHVEVQPLKERHRKNAKHFFQKEAETLRHIVSGLKPQAAALWRCAIVQLLLTPLISSSVVSLLLRFWSQTMISGVLIFLALFWDHNTPNNLWLVAELGRSSCVHKRFSKRERCLCFCVRVETFIVFEDQPKDDCQLSWFLWLYPFNSVQVFIQSSLLWKIPCFVYLFFLMRGDITALLELWPDHCQYTSAWASAETVNDVVQSGPVVFRPLFAQIKEKTAWLLSPSLMGSMISWSFSSAALNVKLLCNWSRMSSVKKHLAAPFLTCVLVSLQRTRIWLCWFSVQNWRKVQVSKTNCPL